MKSFLTYTLFLLLPWAAFAQGELKGSALRLSPTGVLMTPSNGTVTFLGLGNGTDENLTLDLNTANAAVLSSSTGIATVNFSAMGLTTTGGVSTGTLSASGAALFADGTAAAPSIGWTSDADGSGTGWYRSSANSVAGTFNGSERWRQDSANLTYGSGVQIGWSASAATSSVTRDLTLRRLAAASLALGKDDSATPLANTFTVGESSRAGTDSNVAGANGTIASGTGTGTGAVSSLIFQTPTVAGAGTGAQSLATRLTLSSAFAAFIPSVQIEAARAFLWNGRSIIKSPADGKIKISPNAETTGVTLDASTDGTLKLRNLADNADGNLTAGAGTFSGALTYGGVTLSNAVTGTGNMVLSAAPSFTGTIAAASISWTGRTTTTPVPQTATVAAVSVTQTTTALTTTAPGQNVTLADGQDGQIKIIAHVATSGGGTAVLTPATATGYTTITFTNAGETAMLQFHTGVGWLIISLRGAVAA